MSRQDKNKPSTIYLTAEGCVSKTAPIGRVSQLALFREVGNVNNRTDRVHQIDCL